MFLLLYAAALLRAEERPLYLQFLSQRKSLTWRTTNNKVISPYPLFTTAFPSNLHISSATLLRLWKML